MSNYEQFKEWWSVAKQTLKCDDYTAYEIWSSRQSEINELQKRIDGALALVRADCIEYGISDYLEMAMEVIKGDKND